MHMSIKTALIGVICALGLLLAATCTMALWTSYRHYAVSNEVSALATVDKSLYAALDNFRSERRDLATALGLPSDKNQASLKSVAERRVKVDEAFGHALADLADDDTASLKEPLAALQGNYDAFKRLRVEADADLAHASVDERNKDLPKRVLSTGSALIQNFETCASTVEMEIRSRNPALSDIILVQVMALASRSLGGNGAGILNGAVAEGRALEPGDIQSLTMSDAKQQFAWSTVRDVANRPYAAPKLKEAFAQAEAGYFSGPFKAMRDDLVKTVSTGGKPTIAIDEWRGKITPALNLIAGVSSTAIELLDESAQSDAAAATQRLLGYAVLLLVAMGLAIAGLLFVRRRVTRPLTAMTAAMVRLADKDTSVAIPGLGRRDEIGSMATAIMVFKENAIKVDLIAREEAEREAKAAGERRVLMQEMANGFQGAVGSIVQGVLASATQLQASAQALSASAEETSIKSTTVAAAAAQATMNVESVATATEELSASISEIGSQVVRSAEVAGEAANSAGSTQAKIRNLTEAASEIGAVVALIDSIAGQTNLLALNATIEAARAGEAGKGFAVVASEVKQLADQTSKATSQIARQVGSIQSSTQDSALSIGDIAKVIDRLNQISIAISAAVEEQGSVANEIARNVQQAVRGTAAVSQNIAGVSEASRQASEVSAQVLAAARDLSAQSGSLQSEMTRFLLTIRMG